MLLYMYIHICIHIYICRERERQRDLWCISVCHSFAFSLLLVFVYWISRVCFVVELLFWFRICFRCCRWLASISHHWALPRAPPPTDPKRSPGSRWSKRIPELSKEAEGCLRSPRWTKAVPKLPTTGRGRRRSTSPGRKIKNIFKIWN